MENDNNEDIFILKGLSIVGYIKINNKPFKKHKINNDKIMKLQGMDILCITNEMLVHIMPILKQLPTVYTKGIIHAHSSNFIGFGRHSEK